MAIVELSKVTKRYGEVLAVQNFNLSTSDGEFIVLVGPSGCGKTTTMRMIAGLETVSEGEIKIGGKDVVGMIPRERDVAMVFQNYALFPHMNVFGNMSFGLRLRKFPKEQVAERVRSAAKILSIEHLLERKPKELSGGERQRVALGRAIVREPKVFLMDEPLSNIDAKLRVEMRAEIIKLQRRLGVTTFYVTHAQVEALSMGDRIVVMSKGLVQQVGTPKDLYNSPINRYVAGFIGSPSMNFLRVQVGADGTVAAGENLRLVLSKERAAAAVGKGIKEGWVGIRPEHLVIERHPDSATKNVIKGTVEVVEPQGATSILQINIGGEKKIIAQINEQWGRLAGEKLTLTVASELIHLFDPNSDESVR
ncbi:MAG TPA: sn-glycerol-3-phosphate ABC transporter ATP-binding protein UgpC [Chthoniobacterales bacterium]|nr:sn-glycerol-3-phosphate ABC transporter ATP-binding protein UgpC [Chthoniobacterales bacterium]